MRNSHIHTKEFVIGATVGSLLGSVAALLIAPKAGKALRQDICDAYCSFSDKTQNLAKQGKSFAKNLKCQTCDWTNKAKCVVDDTRKTIKNWTSEEEEEDTTKDLLIGGVIGGVLGAVLGLLLAPKSGQELRQDLMDNYEEMSERTQDFADNLTKRGKSFAKTTRSRANKWLDLAKDIVDDLTEEFQEQGEEWFDRIKELMNNRHANEVIDWAHLGYRLWQGIQSKR